MKMDTEIINLTSILTDLQKKIVDLQEVNAAKLQAMGRHHEGELELERDQLEDRLKGMLRDRKRAKEVGERVRQREEEKERVDKEMERFKRNARGRVTGKTEAYFRVEE